MVRDSEPKVPDLPVGMLYPRTVMEVVDKLQGCSFRKRLDLGPHFRTLLVSLGKQRNTPEWRTSALGHQYQLFLFSKVKILRSVST